MIAKKAKDYHPKAPTGIEGFDEITIGGLPRGRTTLIEGGPGSGKTIMALQSLVNGARLHNEPGIFVAFEESSGRIAENASKFGWDLSNLQKKKLFILDAQPTHDLFQSGSFDLSGMLAALEAKMEQIGARRIVIDALDVVLALLNDPVAERQEVYRLNEWLLRHKLTAIITAKAGGYEMNAANRPHMGFMQFMVDCGIVLNHDMIEGVSQRSLRVVKYRGSNFSENESPFLIGNNGLEVAGACELDRVETQISEDITKRKQAEDARRTTEARFRLLVDSNAQGVIFWNAKGEIMGANDAFLNLVHHTREELEAGQVNWMALTPPEYAHLDQLALEQMVATGTCELYEKEFVLKDGTRVPILLGAAVFKDSPGEGVCFVLDLSERKKLEQQFLRAQRMESIGTLAGGIAHDLNNILASILMSIDLLKLSATDPQAKNILESIGLSAKRGADIVRQVLSFARGIEGERIDVQPQHLVAELENIIKDTFPKNIRLQFAVSKEPWMILGDPTQIHQILLNLCVNARDAMPRGGTVTVNLENCVLDDHYVAMNLQAKAGRYVQIGVTDTGTGMPPDVLNKIFEPFFTTKGLNEGTGLGLSTVMAIVKSHGGNVNVYSEQGKGTTFRIYLPAAETSLESAKKQTQDISTPRGNGQTILVVDDEVSILSITTQTLTAFGYRVLIAIDGAEAIALYAENKKDIALVLTDMAMPIMDGTAVIRALLRMNPAVNIIAASGLKLTSNSVQVPQGGIKTFLMKPYTSGALLKAIHSILGETGE